MKHTGGSTHKPRTFGRVSIYCFKCKRDQEVDDVEVRAERGEVWACRCCMAYWLIAAETNVRRLRAGRYWKFKSVPKRHMCPEAPSEPVDLTSSRWLHGVSDPKKYQRYG